MLVPALQTSAFVDVITACRSRSGYVMEREYAAEELAHTQTKILRSFSPRCETRHRRRHKREALLSTQWREHMFGWVHRTSPNEWSHLYGFHLRRR